MNHSYLNKNLIAATVFICLSSSLTGCTLLSKSQDESNANRLSDKITLPQQLDIKIKDNPRNVEISQQDSKVSSPTELFTYAATLSMREINLFSKVNTLSKITAYTLSKIIMSILALFFIPIEPFFLNEISSR